MNNLNHKFSIPQEELEDRLGIRLDLTIEGYDTIIPLRDLSKVDSIIYFRRDLLEKVIRNIPLRGDGSIFPYAEAKIRIYGVEPKGIMVGQTFALESKILGIMNNLEKKFEDYIVKGLSKMLPMQVYGRNAEDKKVMAFYLPPFVERHSGKDLLIDGIHRSTICSSAGTTICPINIDNVLVPPPFDPISWEEVKVVKEKPPIEERYKNLKIELFRDLGYVGIDG